ncbi:MAG: hypothetical protein IAC42_04345 [Spirochaetes bacterium]|uniref:Cyclophilin-like domain-containing protein n=1 Tax=Candidatus Aphodenecus pullistercoris TaxID=2840669 RepID=A0A9D9E885_9SPIR|nr:hypothetical protein [Candidatus Aphodenecus pullistercoris]
MRKLMVIAMLVLATGQLMAEEGGSVRLEIGGRTFTATLEDNEAARVLCDILPLSLDFRDYGGFEKVASLPRRLPSQDRQMRTSAGDIVLYLSNQIVVFYGGNSWSYTKLGHIDDVEGLTEALGQGNVEITFTLQR